MPFHKIYTVFNGQDVLVGETDRIPATVQVEAIGDPQNPTFRLIDGFGKVVLSPIDEIAKLEADAAQIAARKAAIEQAEKDTVAAAAELAAAESLPPVP